MYVVFNANTLRIVAFCNTEAGAKRSAAAQAKRLKRDDFRWTTQENYDTNINTMTTTYSMMDPDRKPIPIRLADKGGCCDPATETYWSM